MTTETHTQTPADETAAGELRQRLREEGWQADLAWAKVSSGTATQAVHASGGEPVRRTIAYLSSVRKIDGGASQLWKEGDVASPPEADAREVMVATPDDPDWHSEHFEVVSHSPDEDDDGPGPLAA